MKKLKHDKNLNVIEKYEIEGMVCKLKTSSKNGTSFTYGKIAVAVSENEKHFIDFNADKLNEILISNNQKILSNGDIINLVGGIKKYTESFTDKKTGENKTINKEKISYVESFKIVERANRTKTILLD